LVSSSDVEEELMEELEDFEDFEDFDLSVLNESLFLTSSDLLGIFPVRRATIFAIGFC